MVEYFPSPAEATYWFIQGRVLFALIILIGTACFAFIVAKRMTPLMRAQRDLRFDQPLRRLGRVLQYWLGQWRHPRYPTAGLIHILLFAGFIILVLRAFSLIILGVTGEGVLPSVPGQIGGIYDIVRDYATTIVFIAVTAAAVRRIVFKPARYAVPPKFGKGHPVDAVFLLVLIGILMLGDGLYEGSRVAGQTQQGLATESLAAFSLPWMFAGGLAAVSLSTLSDLYLAGYLTHELTFFFLLCYRPFGIQFHVETSLLSIYFAKLDRTTLKPVRWGVSEEHLDQVKSFGVKKFEDFTWKHMLDFYSCADCGRCSDQCPSNAVGRPLSPRFLTIKARDYSFRALSGIRPVEQRKPGDRRDLFRGRNLVLYYLRRLRSRMPTVDRVYRQDCRPAAGHGGRRQRSAIASEADESSREPWQSVRQDGTRRRLTGRERKSFSRFAM